MSLIAVVGGGAIGGAVAHALARRDRIGEVRIIDPDGSAARGKALDMQQSSALERFSTRLSAADTILAASGASAIVIADAAASGTEHAGEPALTMLRGLLSAGATAPIVCAGAGQRELIARAVAELRVPPYRILGSAPFALESALRALVAVALDASGTEVSLSVVGVPPRNAVPAWQEAAFAGRPLTSILPPHAVAALTSRIPGLWPPGSYALGAAAARVAEALVVGSRRRFSCFVALEAGPVRAAVTAMPAELQEGRIKRVLEPSLTGQERTRLENAIER